MYVYGNPPVVLYTFLILFRYHWELLLKSEQKLEDMVDIMLDLQEYVPVSTTSHNYQLPGREERVSVKLDDFHYILFGKKFHIVWWSTLSNTQTYTVHAH